MASALATRWLSAAAMAMPVFTPSTSLTHEMAHNMTHHTFAHVMTLPSLVDAVERRTGQCSLTREDCEYAAAQRNLTFQTSTSAHAPPGCWLWTGDSTAMFWRDPAMSCTGGRRATQSHEGFDDCFTGDGATYSGYASTTVTGRTCQRWASDYPHAHGFNDLSSNHCRNPDGYTGPWCYTTDPDQRWELCDVPRCRAAEMDVSCQCGTFGHTCMCAAPPKYVERDSGQCAPDALTEAECQAVASLKGLSFSISAENYAPPGCWEYPGLGVYYRSPSIQCGDGYTCECGSYGRKCFCSLTALEISMLPALEENIDAINAHLGVLLASTQVTESGSLSDSVNLLFCTLSGFVHYYIYVTNLGSAAFRQFYSAHLAYTRSGDDSGYTVTLGAHFHIAPDVRVRVNAGTRGCVHNGWYLLDTTQRVTLDVSAEIVLRLGLDGSARCLDFDLVAVNIDWTRTRINFPTLVSAINSRIVDTATRPQPVRACLVERTRHSRCGVGRACGSGAAL